MDVRSTFQAGGSGTQESKADSRVQVYYFYSYGTAAWAGEFDVLLSFQSATDLDLSPTSRAVDCFSDHDRGTALSRSARSVEYVPTLIPWITFGSLS